MLLDNRDMSSMLKPNGLRRKLDLVYGCDEDARHDGLDRRHCSLASLKTDWFAYPVSHYQPISRLHSVRRHPVYKLPCFTALPEQEKVSSCRQHSANENSHLPRSNSNI